MRAERDIVKPSCTITPLRNGSARRMRRVGTIANIFTQEVPRLKEPKRVIERLHTLVHAECDLSLYGVWCMPANPVDARAFASNRQAWLHPGAPPAFRPEYIKARHERGPGVIARMAMHRHLPFTFTECMHSSRAANGDRWDIEVLRKHGMRDGVFCPIGRHRVMFYSQHPVRLTADFRTLIHVMGSLAVTRIDELQRLGDGRRRLEPKTGLARLSSREAATLQALALGDDVKEIAKKFGVGEASVYTYVHRAMKKLKAKTPLHAAGIAIRQMLIQ